MKAAPYTTKCRGGGHVKKLYIAKSVTIQLIFHNISPIRIILREKVGDVVADAVFQAVEIAAEAA